MIPSPGLFNHPHNLKSSELLEPQFTLQLPPTTGNSSQAETMHLNLFASKALCLTTLLGLTQAAALPEPVHADITPNQLEARIAGNEAIALYCYLPNDKRCGIWVSYTNGQTRRSVSFQATGANACRSQMGQRHTNDGFWSQASSNFGAPVVRIGYNPSRSTLDLAISSRGSNDHGYVNARCANEFHWGETVAQGKSVEYYFPNLRKKLF